MINLTKIYSQNDTRWANSPLGVSSSTIGRAGCYVTAYANLANFYNHDIDVLQMNQALIDAGQFSDSSEISSGDSLSKVYADIEYQTRGIDYQMMTEYLNNNNPVILNLYAPNLAGSHFVLALGYDGDNLMIADSWDGTIEPAKIYGAIQEMLFYKPQINTNQNKPMPEILKQKMFDLITSLRNDTVRQSVYDNWDRANGNTTEASLDKEPLVWIKDMIDQSALFHIKTEDQLNAWINQWGLTRLYELGQYSQVETWYNRLVAENKIIKPDTNQSTIELANLRIANQQLASKINEYSQQLSVANQKIKDLELQIQQGAKQNSSDKPIWQSKKAIITLIALIASTVLSIYSPDTFIAIRNSPVFPLVGTYLLAQSGIDIVGIFNQTKLEK